MPYENERAVAGNEEGGLHCPVGKRCGGCEWLTMPYERQLDLKQEQVEELFADMGVAVEPIVGMADPRRFRNKVQLPFAPGRPGRDGRVVPRWGIFERGTHNIVPCRECLVEDERARPVIAAVAELMPRFNIPAYDERGGSGLLRYALVRTALHTGQLMLTLVCNGGRIPSQRRFVEELVAACPGLSTIVLNVNRERTSVILGKEEKVLFGPGYIEDEICGCTFRISSSSFYQTNPAQAEVLYELAIEMADLRPGDFIADAYCGTGTIGIAAARASGARLLGVERNADAVADARANAEVNGLADAEFVVGDAGGVFARMARGGAPGGAGDLEGAASAGDLRTASTEAGAGDLEGAAGTAGAGIPASADALAGDTAGADAGAGAPMGGAHPKHARPQLDVVFMDPPRAGSTTAFLANLAKLGPRRVVYISCEPRTQRHDVGELRKFGYQVRRIRPVDMFPHTSHVENVVLLERTERPQARRR